MASQISTTVTLKPLRLAYLIHPRDRDSLLKAIEANTLLWGGIWNPIIPTYRRPPAHTSNGRPRRPTGSEWLNGHLRFFQPEAVVYGADTSPPPSYPGAVSIGIDDFLHGVRRAEPAHGLSIIHLIQYLYQRRYRFVEHNPPPPLTLVPPSPHATLHDAVLRGYVSDQPDALNIAYYRTMLRATTKPLTPGLLHSHCHRRVLTSLDLTTAETPRAHSGRPAVVLYNHKVTSDLLYLWNLRTCTPIAAAIPCAWLDKLRELFVVALRSLHTEPNERGLGGSFPRVIVLPGARLAVTNARISDLMTSYDPDPPPRVLLDEMPTLWDRSTTKSP